MKAISNTSQDEIQQLPEMEKFAAVVIDKKDVKPLTKPSIVAEGGTQQIKLYKLKPEDIEKYLLMHPVIPRGIEIRANRITSRGFTINSYNNSQQAKRAAKEIETLLNNSGGVVLINNFIQNTYAFGDAYITLVPNKKNNKIVLLNLEHPVFFRVARYKKQLSPERAYLLEIHNPKDADNFSYEYGMMKIDGITKKPAYYTQVTYDTTKNYYMPIGEEIPASSVAHLFFDSWGDEVTGISLLQYVYTTIHYLLNIEEAAAENQYRNGFTQKKITTDMMTERELKEISRNIKDINSKDAIILPRGVDLDNLIPGTSQFPQFHDKFLDLLAIRLGIPKPILTLDASTSNKASMDEMSKDMMKDIQADELKVKKVIEDQIIVPACKKLFGENFAAFPTFDFNPFQETEDSKAARQFRIAQTLDALSRAAGTLVEKGYSKRAEQLLNYIDEILPKQKSEVEEGENDKLNRRDKQPQKVTTRIPDQSKGEDAGSQGKLVGRPDGGNAVNVRGKKVSPKPAPDVK